MPHRYNVCDTLPHAQQVLGTLHAASVLFPRAAGCDPGSRRQSSAPDARCSPRTFCNARRKSRGQERGLGGRRGPNAAQETRGSFLRPPLRSCWLWTGSQLWRPRWGAVLGARFPESLLAAILRPSETVGCVEHSRAVSGEAARPGAACHSASEGPAHQGLGGRLLLPAQRVVSPSAHACSVLHARAHPALSTGPLLGRSGPRLARSPFLFPVVCLFTPDET